MFSFDLSGLNLDFSGLNFGMPDLSGLNFEIPDLSGLGNISVPTVPISPEITNAPIPQEMAPVIIQTPSQPVAQPANSSGSFLGGFSFNDPFGNAYSGEGEKIYEATGGGGGLAGGGGGGLAGIDAVNPQNPTGYQDPTNPFNYDGTVGGVDPTDPLDMGGTNKPNTDPLDMGGSNAINTDPLDLGGENTINSDPLDLGGSNQVNTNPLDYQGEVGGNPAGDPLGLGGQNAINQDPLDLGGSNQVNTNPLDYQGEVGGNPTGDPLGLGGQNAINQDPLDYDGTINQNPFGYEGIPGLGGGETESVNTVDNSGAEQTAMLNAKLAPFHEMLKAINPQFTDMDLLDQRFNRQRFDKLGQLGVAAGERTASQLGDIYNRQMATATGTDPRFQQFANAQRDLMRTQTEGQVRQASDMFGRRGLGESSASLNAQMGLRGQGQMQERALMSQLGLQEMGRQDQALNLAGLTAQSQLGSQMSGYGFGANAQQMSNQVGGQQLDYMTAGLQNLLADPTLNIAMIAAQNAGKMPPEKSPGLLTNIFDKIGI